MCNSILSFKGNQIKVLRKFLQLIVCSVLYPTIYIRDFNSKQKRTVNYLYQVQLDSRRNRIFQFIYSQLTRSSQLVLQFTLLLFYTCNRRQSPSSPPLWLHPAYPPPSKFMSVCSPGTTVGSQSDRAGGAYHSKSQGNRSVVPGYHFKRFTNNHQSRPSTLRLPPEPCVVTDYCPCGRF